MHSQKCSMVFPLVANPKNLPPSNRISILEHAGLAHFWIMDERRAVHYGWTPYSPLKVA
jgi:hypothetical protein